MMERSFSEALKQRRTYYSITNQSPISDTFDLLIGYR